MNISAEKSNVCSLKCETKWVDVSTTHLWLKKKFPNLIDAMTILERETDKAVLLRDPFKIGAIGRIEGRLQNVWVAKSLVQIVEIK